MNGPKEGTRIELSDAKELVFGRDETADIVLKDDLVSRRHAKVRRDWSGTHVEDLGSRNGIKVNKKRASRQTLRDRDEVQIGGVRLLYLDPSEVREVESAPDEEEEGEATSAEPSGLQSQGGGREDELEEEPEDPEPSGVDEESELDEPPAEAEEPDEDFEDDALPDGTRDEGDEDDPPEPQGGRALQFGRGRVAIPDTKSLIPLVGVGLLAFFALLLALAVLLGF